ncbi:MAG TPA: HIG1 domain-containing protein [Alphaproteobacteria bacterium]
MNIFLTVMLGLCVLVVVASLVAGFVAMGRGGEFNQKYGNKLMRVRVMAQGAALLFLALLMMNR